MPSYLGPVVGDLSQVGLGWSRRRDLAQVVGICLTVDLDWSR